MFKCNSESDTDESTDRNCFKINCRKLLFKRKLSNGNGNVDDAGNDDLQVPTHYNEMSSNVVQSSINTSTPDQQQRQRNYDPTYGFARFTQSSPQSQDILYPLRTSTGSKSSTNSSLQSLHFNPQNVNHLYNQASCMPNEANQVPRKRVKFDDNPINYSAGGHLNAGPNYYMNGDRPYQFGNVRYDGENKSSQSLRSRIINFFSNLF